MQVKEEFVRQVYNEIISDSYPRITKHLKNWEGVK